MKNDPSSNSGNSDTIKTILNAMKTEGKLKGVVLAKRNGDLIAENIENDFDGHTFAAMCASVLESAEDLKKTLGSKKLRKIIAELESGQTIIIIECDNTSFLSFILKKESKIEPILNNIEKYCQKIIKSC